MVEDERVYDLNDCAVDGSHLLCDSPDFVFWDSAFAEESEGDVQVWEHLWVVPCFGIVGRDICRLFCRVSVDPVTGQNALPSLLAPLVRLEAVVISVYRRSGGKDEGNFIDILLPTPWRWPRPPRPR
jgi:hypothetical protein